MSIRLELTMPLENGSAFLNSALSVCFAMRNESFALEKRHPGCPFSGISDSATDGQAPLAWQEKRFNTGSEVIPPAAG